MQSRFGQKRQTNEVEAMFENAHLWAIAYDDPARAEEARRTILRLGSPQPFLVLLDTVIVVRRGDGTLTLDREPISPVSNIVGFSTLGFLAGLVVSAPVTGAAIGLAFGSASAAIAGRAGIKEAFIEEIAQMMKPNTAVLFVLDDGSDMDVIVPSIRGLGGTVLRTNVDVERARLIQSTLQADSTQPAQDQATFN